MRATATRAPRRNVVRAIVGEYREMPGLRLTARQAAYLWRLGPDEARAVLDALVDHHVLATTRDTVELQYRLADGHHARSRTPRVTRAH